MKGRLSLVLTVWGLAASTALGSAATIGSIEVVVGAQAPQLEQYAGQQLGDYLQKLFQATVRVSTVSSGKSEVLFLVGNPENKSRSPRGRREDFPSVSDQGIVLKRVTGGRGATLVVGGGSPKATLWAVYELVERWGVRYLLDGDVFPEKTALRLPESDLVMEPRLRMRMWRVVNEHATGPCHGGCPMIDRFWTGSTKLKFNWLNINIWPHGPFLHYEYKGVKRNSGALFWGFRYPITDDMIGRHLFGEEKELWNRDLPIGADYGQLTEAGGRLIQGLIDYGQSRGMQSMINANLSDFPPEFGPTLTDWQKAHQLNELTIAPGPKTLIDDPNLTGLAVAILRALVNTYPKVDYVVLGMPEFRQWSDFYEQAWKALDAKYGLEKICSLASVVEASHRRTGSSIDPERALMEVKGDIVNLYFYDRLLRDRAGASGNAPARHEVRLFQHRRGAFPDPRRGPPAGGRHLKLHRL